MVPNCPGIWRYGNLRKIGLFLCIAIATTMVAEGQQSSLLEPSRIDVFAGYSYWQANGSAGGVAFSNTNHGVLISGAYYLNRNFGFELVGDYHFTGGNDSMRSVSFGPILRGEPHHGFTPFVHGLAGATNMLGPGAFYAGHSANCRAQFTVRGLPGAGSAH